MAYEEIQVKAQIDECLKLFDGMNANKKMIRKYLMRSIGTGAKRAAKQGYGAVLSKRSGKLYKSIKSNLRFDGSKLYITNDADSGKNTAKDGRAARYGFMLASGYTIEGKTDRGLTFNVNGKWITKHKVTVPPKDWIDPPVNRYMEGPRSDEDLEKALAKQVAYWEKRLTGGTTA